MSDLDKIRQYVETEIDRAYGQYKNVDPNSVDAAWECATIMALRGVIHHINALSTDDVNTPLEAAKPLIQAVLDFPCLEFDLDVSDVSPVVKGTYITTDHVINLIVDGGWSWSDVLRSHPEITENDLRECLTYAIKHGD